MFLKRVQLSLLLAVTAVAMGQAQPATPPADNLVWDHQQQEVHPKPGDARAEFTFYFTNTTSSEIVITNKHHCGCTAATMPPLPWTNAPGAVGKMEFSMDLAGKMGTVIKTVTLDTTAGKQYLTLTVVVPDKVMSRDSNMKVAAADRQAVFKGDCVVCHATPAAGKQGQALYQAVCGICHEAIQRAPAVPDLHHLRHPTDLQYWTTWITGGKTNTMMPAFAAAQGGPLTLEQISSLADYLNKAIPSQGQ